MGVFGPWLPLLLGAGAFLLAGGLLAKETVTDPMIKGLGRAAASAGLKMLLLVATIYLLVLALAAAFENMISNLPGM